MQFDAKRKKAYILLLLNTILWGAAFPIVKNAFDDTTPYRFLLYRYAIATILILPVIVYLLPRVKDKIKTNFKIVLCELVGLTLSLSLLYVGLDKVGSIEAGLISLTSPLFIIIGGIIFYKEKQERHELLGMIIAVTGTLIVTVAPVLEDPTDFSGVSMTGNIILITQSLIGAIYWLIIKKVYRNVPKLYAASISFIIGLISFYFIALIESGSNAQLAQNIAQDLSSPSVIFASIYMAIGGSIIGLTMLLKTNDYIEVSESTLFTYLQPTIYIPLGVLWLGEKVNTVQIVALILITTGVMYASRRTKKNSKLKR